MHADCLHDTAERAGSRILDVGEPIAVVTGSPSEVTVAGPGGTIASFGISVPIQVAEQGSYAVTASLFVVLASPCFVYRYLWRRKGT